MGWSLNADALPGHPQPGSRAGQGAAGGSTSPGRLHLLSLLLLYYVCVTSFTSYSSVSSWCMGSCSFPQGESWQNTCPSCCLLLLLTSTLTTPSSHFLIHTEMEISWLLSFAWFFFTCTSCFQLPLYYSWLLLLTLFAPNSSLPKTDHCVCFSLQPLLPFSHSCISSLAILCAGVLVLTPLQLAFVSCWICFQWRL